MSGGIEIKNLVRQYVMGENVVTAVDGVDMSIPEGKYTILLGTSGAGKSTVLNILGGMDTPTSDVLIHMKSGKVEDLSYNDNPTPVQDLEW